MFVVAGGATREVAHDKGTRRSAGLAMHQMLRAGNETLLCRLGGTRCCGCGLQNAAWEAPHEIVWQKAACEARFDLGLSFACETKNSALQNAAGWR